MGSLKNKPAVASKIDGYDESTMPLTWRHIRIVSVCSLGQLVGTAVATIAGIIIPMINILSHPELSSWMQGLIGAADLIGIMVGSVILGKLSDRYGYLLFFRLCPLLITVAAISSVIMPHIWVLIVSLFVIGFGIGGEYSLDSDYVSELMPANRERVMVGVTKAASALGNIIAAGLAFVWVMSDKEASSWPYLMLIVAGIGLVMLLSRIKFYQSPRWLMDHGREAEAERSVQLFLGPDVHLDMVKREGIKREASKGANTVDPMVENQPEGGQTGSAGFIKRYFSRVVLSGVPWACEGLGVYGIGVFIPILVMALGLEGVTAGSAPIMHVAESIRTTLWISCIILPGFIIGLILTSRQCNIWKLQAFGFGACTIALVVLLMSYHGHGLKWLSLGAFMAFELFLNIGPHLVTYLLPSQIYPASVRGQGTGIAASIGKVGAVVGVFVIPVLLKYGGAELVLGVSAAVMGVGMIVTMVYGPQVMKR